MHDKWPLFRVDEGVGECQLKSLPHDEAAENLVESVPIFRLTDDDVLQFGVLHPARVLGQDSGLERERLVVHRLDEEIVNQPLLFLRGRMLEERIRARAIATRKWNKKRHYNNENGFLFLKKRTESFSGTELFYFSPRDP